jgi:hypothetical protein
MTQDWIGKKFEAPTTEVFVGLQIEDARRTAAATAGVAMIREMGSNGTYTLDYRKNRLSLLVVDGVVVAAAMF